MNRRRAASCIMLQLHEELILPIFIIITCFGLALAVLAYCMMEKCGGEKSSTSRSNGNKNRSSFSCCCCLKRRRSSSSSSSSIRIFESLNDFLFEAEGPEDQGVVHTSGRDYSHDYESNPVLSLDVFFPDLLAELESSHHHSEHDRGKGEVIAGGLDEPLL